MRRTIMLSFQRSAVPLATITTSIRNGSVAVMLVISSSTTHSPTVMRVWPARSRQLVSILQQGVYYSRGSAGYPRVAETRWIRRTPSHTVCMHGCTHTAKLAMLVSSRENITDLIGLLAPASFKFSCMRFSLLQHLSLLHLEQQHTAPLSYAFAPHVHVSLYLHYQLAVTS